MSDCEHVLGTGYHRQQCIKCKEYFTVAEVIEMTRTQTAKEILREVPIDYKIDGGQLWYRELKKKFGC